VYFKTSLFAVFAEQEQVRRFTSGIIMRAVVITRPGVIDVLEIREVADAPAPTADRVRVRVRASALNRADVIQRMGFYPAPPGAPADIPGLEFSGEVERLGPEVREWQPGDRVFGICGGGAHAEFVTVPASHLARIPSNLDWAETAAVPEVFMTAHDALFTQARLQPGETVLVHAAGSGVGTAAIQLTRASGARSFGTSRTADKLERAKEYGLDGSLVVGGDPLTFVEPVKQWSGGVGVDVVLDLVGAGYLEANLRAMALKGRMVHVGTTSGSKATLELGLVMSKRLTLRGTVLRARSVEEKATVTRLFAKHVVPLLGNGLLKPVVDRAYKLDQIREAHKRLESNENFGKIVLMI
jgi:putative PIG3 family NAD(P)H quinone oxidoreductase